MHERPIRVMIVEDSSVVLMLLQEIVRSHPRLELAASVASAEEALRLLPTAKPDVISLDIRLPGINGLEATRRIMTLQPTPIVVLSASVDSDDLKISMNALRAGALTVIEKPTVATAADYAAVADRLCRQLILMSEVPVIRQRHRFEHDGVKPVPASAGAAQQLHPPTHRGGFAALGIVASTGGPNAVVTVLQVLGRQFPLPILLVQHITPSFLGGFAAWLSGVTGFPVVIAQDGELLQPGSVYMAPADMHLEVRAGRVRLADGPAVDGQRPSGTVLLASMARELGQRAIGVVLTGMGEDGAKGLRALYDVGGYTIAEDRSTAVVYGMPAAAERLGAAMEQLPLPRIGARIREALDVAPAAT
jgi:two-component system, chemotaxis family, protein-glutamate methylesterase/glutaminase